MDKSHANAPKEHLTAYWRSQQAPTVSLGQIPEKEKEPRTHLSMQHTHGHAVLKTGTLNTYCCVL